VFSCSAAFCTNGGVCRANACVCPSQWTGPTCSTAVPPSAGGLGLIIGIVVITVVLIFVLFGWLYWKQLCCRFCYSQSATAYQSQQDGVGPMVTNVQLSTMQPSVAIQVDSARMLNSSASSSSFSSGAVPVAAPAVEEQVEVVMVNKRGKRTSIMVSSSMVAALDSARGSARGSADGSNSADTDAEVAAAKALRATLKAEMKKGKQASMADDTASSAAASGLGASKLPHPWQALQTDQGAVYYHNTVTDETSWDFPSA
jgi:hypothetical protein